VTKSHSEDKEGTGQETDVELRRDVSPVNFLFNVVVFVLFQMLRLDTLSRHIYIALFQFRVFKIPTECDSAVFCLLREQELPVLHVRAGLGCLLTFLVPNYFPNCSAQTKTLYAAPHCQLYSHTTFLSRLFSLRTAQPGQKTVTNCRQKVRSTGNKQA
jgi:hypothetical protein